jgi:transcription termination/antitermination protein NusG
MKKWYIIHTLSGAEDKVKANLEAKISAGKLESKIDDIMVPKEQVSEVKKGQKRFLERKIFPGYILIHTELDNQMLLFIKNTPGVTSFIGSKGKPSSISEEEVDRILKKSEETQAKPLPKVAFEEGESVRIIEGAFVNFNGLVTEVNIPKGKLKVSVSIFGRSTPVELEFWQVEKI